MGDEALWNAKATVINIQRKNQMLVTVQSNNTGDNLNENALDHIDISDISSYEPLPSQWTPLAITSLLPISRQRSTFNNSVSVGLNQQHKIGTYGSLRTNISAYWDDERTSNLQTLKISFCKFRSCNDLQWALTGIPEVFDVDGGRHIGMACCQVVFSKLPNKLLKEPLLAPQMASFAARFGLFCNALIAKWLRD